MTALFVSHSSRDNEAVKVVQARLEERGYDALFLDFDERHGIRGGTRWEEAIYLNLHRCDAVLFIATPASCESSWCFAELAFARCEGKRVFPLLLEAGAYNALLGDTQSIDLTTRDDRAFARLWDALEGAGLGPEDSFHWNPRRAPYPGLQSFEEDDAGVFFGRDREIDELLAHLTQPPYRDVGRCVAVIGPSGSGKSSLVRAGLVPRLTKRREEWVVVPPFTPTSGATPLGALALRLEERLPQGYCADVEQRLLEDAGSLLKMAWKLCGASRCALVVVDQAEELVTHASEEERSAILRALEAALSARAPLWVVLVMRSEFLTEVLGTSALGSLIGKSLIVRPLDVAGLREVIERPAQRAGVRFQRGLVDRMIEETRGGDALPLLAYTLAELYKPHEYGTWVTIDSADYERVGGVVGSLTRHADRVLAALGDQKLEPLPVLRNLANVDADREPTRRRVRWRDLEGDERRLLSRFVEARLLSIEGKGDEAVVQVVHEALLRVWTPLRQEIEGARSELRKRCELERLATDWNERGRPEYYLLRGDRLRKATDWAEKNPRDVRDAPLLGEFLAASAASDRGARAREANLVADRVLAGFPDDPELGVALATAAIETYHATPRAVKALHAALCAWRLRRVFRGHRRPISSVAFAPSGLRLATTASDGSGRVWELTAEQDDVASVAIDPAVGVATCAAFSPDGSELAIGARDGTIRLCLAGTGAVRLYMRQVAPVLDLAFAPSGTSLAAASEDGVRVWSCVAPTEPVHLTHLAFPDELEHEDTLHPACRVAFSPQGERLVHSCEEVARVWNVVTGRHLHVLEGHDGEVCSVAFSPNGARIVTGSADGTARVWRTETGDALLVLRGHEAPVLSAAFNSDGTVVVTVSSDGTVRCWSATTGTEQLAYRHERALTVAAVAADGTAVATGADDGSVRVWSVAPDGQLLVLPHPAEVLSGAFANDGARVLTVCADKSAYIWDALLGARLVVLRGGVEEASFSADGTSVVTRTTDGSSYAWDARTGAAVAAPATGGLADAARASWAASGTVRSPAGRQQVTVTGGRAAAARDGMEEFVLHQGDEVCGAGFDPSGTYVITASTSGTLRFWDATTGEALFVLHGHVGRVTDVGFSADGSRMITASEDGTARTWETPTLHGLLATARRRGARRLTEVERRRYGFPPG